MLRFLTPEWFDALDLAAAGLAAPGKDVVVQYVVTGDDSDTAYHLAADAGVWRVRGGLAEHPTVVLTLDRDTAGRIARGELSAQGAFMSGRLRIGGDPLALVRHREAVAQLDERFRLVRDGTEW